jgi:hypothetical protein
VRFPVTAYRRSDSVSGVLSTPASRHAPLALVTTFILRSRLIQYSNPYRECLLRKRHQDWARCSVETQGRSRLEFKSCAWIQCLSGYSRTLWDPHGVLVWREWPYHVIVLNCLGNTLEEIGQTSIDTNAVFTYPTQMVFLFLTYIYAFMFMFIQAFNRGVQSCYLFHTYFLLNRPLLRNYNK